MSVAQFVLKGAQRELWLTFLIKLFIISAYAITNKTLILWLSYDLGFSDQAAGALVGWVWAPAMTICTLLAGSLTDGTVTWMAGPATVESHIVPRISEAAKKAGRAAPRVSVGLPVCITNDVDAAREAAAKTFAIYGQLPSYRAMLDKEGAPGPADVARRAADLTVAAG